MRYILFILLTSCATNMPTGYNQLVNITGGEYQNMSGRLVGDCSGIENYQVLLDDNRLICVRSWNMERI